jgi:two-component system OmpR family sensor kinase
MSRLSLRTKVTLVFVAVMGLVLAAVGWFLFLRTKSNLDGAIRESLRTRAGDLVQSVRVQSTRDAPGNLIELGERYAQILTVDGRVVESRPQGAAALLTRAEAQRAAHRRGFIERPEQTRMLAIPVRSRGRPFVAVVATSLAERERALEGLGRALLIGGPLALLFAAGLAYAVAAAALRPVESMRRRAAQITEADPHARLPVPAAQDEIHRLGVTLNEMLARLADAADRQRAFVANASHELRSPLATIRAELELAARDAKTPDDFRAATEAAIADADTLAKLADDLLGLARNKSGAIELHPEDLDVGELLALVAREFGDRVDLDGRELRIGVAPRLRIRGDPERLRQALRNMVENALLHGAGTITLSAARSDTTVDLSVADEGLALSADSLAHLFERFERGSAPTDRPGSGLGLAIVREIARAHGGDAELTNQGPSGGVRCTIRLPT